MRVAWRVLLRHRWAEQAHRGRVRCEGERFGSVCCCGSCRPVLTRPRTCSPCAASAASSAMLASTMHASVVH